MKAISRISSTVAPLPLDNVDTDQIIPASFLKGVDREGLAEGLFHGWRLLENGRPDPDFVLNQPGYEAAEILLVGENFGCGSSREHASWALLAWGVRVVMGRGFADIFRSNAHRNGLLTITLSARRYAELLAQLRKEPGANITIDLVAQEVTFPDASTERFDVDPFARHCMLHGLDPLGHLLEHLPGIGAHENRRPAPVRIRPEEVL